MNQPGEWYYDKAARAVYYVPLDGESLDQMEVIAPVLETLVSGTGSVGNPVVNLFFTGITFAYATWLRPSGPVGFVEVQANHAPVGKPPSGHSFPGALAFKR